MRIRPDLSRAGVAAAAVAAVAVLVAGCGTTPTTSAPEPSAPSTDQSTPPSASPSAPPGPSEDDRDLAGALVALATTPDPETLAAVRFAPEVALGLGRRLETARPRDRLARSAGWSIDARSFRAHAGPFNALELVAAQATDPPLGPARGLAAFAVTIGTHPRCAGPPVPAPRGLEDLRRVSLQPATGTIDGCLEWFTVDLFVDHDGIVAVTLDLWEP